MSARKRVTVALTVIAAMVALTGCGETEREPSSIERGKACAEAGGEWTWSEWSGYHCEFLRGDSDE
jgi:hypothetical protein